ncbi:MAG: hypothetical protein EOS09_18570 [Mesorhizobium sp.]|nr:MAG: hypothetical protein EOS09_18570 [Mesorhizobium sp.]RWO83044.1 MAG: hypothetical protein EOS18_05410 [Mesorhizobium sp.]TIN05945.1 MAG: hypothetical protein E5Y14_31080 [Mesorhizobium sp.]
MRGVPAWHRRRSFQHPSTVLALRANPPSPTRGEGRAAQTLSCHAGHGSERPISIRSATLPRQKDKGLWPAKTTRRPARPVATATRRSLRSTCLPNM